MKIFRQDIDLLYRIGQIKDLVKTKTVQQSAIVLSGNIVSTILSIITTILIARKIGPVGYGILAIYLTTYTAVLGMTDFGLGTTAVKLISSNLDKNPHKSHVYMKVIVFMEIIAGIIVAIAGILFSRTIANSLGGENLLFPVRMAFVAAAFASTGAFVGPFLAAHQKFFKNSVFGVSQSIIKTLGVVFLFFTLLININNIIIFYTLINIIAFFVGILISPKGFLEKSTKNENKKAFKDIFHFSKWILLSYFASVISSRLDIFLLSRFRGPEEVGIYAAAQQLAQIMPLITGALTTVLLPRVSKMKTKTELKGYLKKVVLGSILIDILLIPLIIFANMIVKIIFGSKFDSSIELFRILLFGFMFAVISGPTSLVLYAKNKPKSLTAISYATLIITVILNFILIPRFGANGAAYVFVLSNLIALIALIPLIIYEINSVKK